jgi:hypothetical protein
MYKPALEPRRCVQEVELIQRRYASKSLTATDLSQQLTVGAHPESAHEPSTVHCIQLLSPVSQNTII